MPWLDKAALDVHFFLHPLESKGGSLMLGVLVLGTIFAASLIGVFWHNKDLNYVESWFLSANPQLEKGHVCHRI